MPTIDYHAIGRDAKLGAIKGSPLVFRSHGFLASYIHSHAADGGRVRLSHNSKLLCELELRFEPVVYGKILSQVRISMAANTTPSEELAIAGFVAAGV